MMGQWQPSSAGAGAEACDAASLRKSCCKVPRFKAAEEIARLEELISQHKNTVQNLQQRHHGLAARARAAHIAVMQCLALLRLGALRQQQQEELQQQQMEG